MRGGLQQRLSELVGEAGVGKSRVVYEFTHSHRLQGWLILEAASVSYGKATSEGLRGLTRAVNAQVRSHSCAE